MCLTKLTTKKAKVAKEDIVCYKVLNKDLTSPYKYFQYELGGCTKSDLEINNDLSVQYGLHSFKYKKGANEEVEEWVTETTQRGDTIMQCVIPKGAEYYEGVFEGARMYTDKASYASNELIVTKKL